MDGRPVSFEGSRETIASVYERIEEYRAEFGGHLDARASLLARGEDDGASWLERLGSVELTGGYRDALSEDGLWAIVENPASPPTARAAAALVLRRAPKNRERLGTISSFVATPKVRVALERCAEEDATEQELHEVALEVTDRRATAPSGRAR